MATFGTFVDDVTLKASEINSLLESTTFTPDLVQGNTITYLASRTSFYFRVNKLVIGVMKVKTSSGAVGGNPVVFTLPVAPSSGSFDVIGTGFVLTNIGQYRRMALVKRSDGKASFLPEVATSITGYWTDQLISADIGAVFAYEAA